MPGLNSSRVFYGNIAPLPLRQMMVKMTVVNTLQHAKNWLDSQ